jgi:uncharacterized membrane protein
MTNKSHTILLLCFDGTKAAADARQPLEAALQANGDTILDTVILKTDEKHKSSVYDPRRVVAGTLTAAVTWGIFGLLTGSNGWSSLVIWAIIGAVSGGLFAYFSQHILTKDQLARIGERLPANTSALLTFTETGDPRQLLETAAAYVPSVASVAVIEDDLSAQTFTHPADVGETRSSQNTLLNMILLRFPSAETAKQIAARYAAAHPKPGDGPLIELVIDHDPGGRIHVEDPTHGVKAWSMSNLTSWGGFGLVLGAIGGLTGGGGLFGLLRGGLLTGIFWGLFGLVAGILYGRWAGTAVTGRRLKSIGPMLPPGTSMLVAWDEGPMDQATLDKLSASDSQHLVLRFNRVERGAILEVG